MVSFFLFNNRLLTTSITKTVGSHWASRFFWK